MDRRFGFLPWEFWESTQVLHSQISPVDFSIAWRLFFEQPSTRRSGSIHCTWRNKLIHLCIQSCARRMGTLSTAFVLFSAIFVRENLTTRWSLPTTKGYESTGNEINSNFTSSFPVSSVVLALFLTSCFSWVFPFVKFCQVRPISPDSREQLGLETNRGTRLP